MSGIDNRAEEESGDWGTGGEEDAVVFDSVEYVRFVDKIYGTMMCNYWLVLLYPENE